MALPRDVSPTEWGPDGGTDDDWGVAGKRACLRSDGPL